MRVLKSMYTYDPFKDMEWTATEREYRNANVSPELFVTETVLGSAGANSAPYILIDLLYETSNSIPYHMLWDNE